MTEKRTYKRYPKEFKEEAVSLVREQGYTVTEAAKARKENLRIVVFVLSNKSDFTLLITNDAYLKLAEVL